MGVMHILIVEDDQVARDYLAKALTEVGHTVEVAVNGLEGLQLASSAAVELAIVDRIVDAHGGRLSIESRAGEGTTVTVFLPRQSAGDPPATQRARSRGGSDVRA